MDDESLVRRAQQGDDDAFRALFRATQPAVLRYLRVCAGQAADDLAGEVWVAVVRGLRDFIGDDNGFKAWTLTIARRRWIDELRRRDRRPEYAGLPLPEPLPAPDAATEALALVATEQALALIATLPRHQAEVVVLRHVADLDVATTARLLEMTEGAVRVACLRGLRRLGELLASGDGAVTPGSLSSVEQVS